MTSERVVEVLARVAAENEINCTGLGEVGCRGLAGWHTWHEHRRHIAELQAEALAPLLAEVRAEALREAADEAEQLRSFAHGKNPTSEAHLIGYGTARRGIVRLLRDRADREQVPGERREGGEGA